MRQSVLVALVVTAVVAVTNAESPPIVPIMAVLNPCKLSKVIGRCRAAFPRYYFDGKKCVKFTYGGCGGNANNFKTLMDCRCKCHSKGLSRAQRGKCKKPFVNGKGPLLISGPKTYTYYWRKVGKQVKPMPRPQPKPLPRPQPKPLPRPQPKPKLIEYTVLVRTGDKPYAGTDANVFLIVNGRKVQLKGSFTHWGNKKFERKQMDLFVAHLPAGKIDKITIGHDNKGSGPGWYLDSLWLTRKNDKKNQLKFKCNCWLAKDEGDKKIVRTIKRS